MPQHGVVSEVESEQEDLHVENEKLISEFEDYTRTEVHKISAEDRERRVREEYEVLVREAPMQPLQAPETREKSIPERGFVVPAKPTFTSEVEELGEIHIAPQKQRQQLPQAGIMRKTKVPEMGHLSEPESEPEEVYEVSVIDETYKTEDHKRVVEEHEKRIREEYEEVYKPVDVGPEEVPLAHKHAIPHSAKVAPAVTPQRAQEEVQGELHYAPEKRRQQLPQAGVMSKTKVPDRAVVSEPESDVEEEDSMIERKQQLDEERIILHDEIRRIEDHKKVTEEHDKTVREEYEVYSQPERIQPVQKAQITLQVKPIQEAKPEPQPEALPAPQRFMQQLPQAGVMTSTKVPERSVTTEPEPEPESDQYEEYMADVIYSGAPETISYTEEIIKEEDHKRLIEEHDTKITEISDEVQPLPVAYKQPAPQDFQRILPQAGVISKPREIQQSDVQPLPEAQPAPEMRHQQLPQAGVIGKTQVQECHMFCHYFDSSKSFKMYQTHFI